MPVKGYTLESNQHIQQILKAGVVMQMPAFIFEMPAVKNGVDFTAEMF